MAALAQDLRLLSLAFNSSSGFKNIQQLSYLQDKFRFFMLYYGDYHIAEQLKIKHQQHGKYENSLSVLGTDSIFPPVQKVLATSGSLSETQARASVSQTAGLWTPFCLDNPTCTFRLISLTRITSRKQQEPAERCVVLPSDCAGRDASFAPGQPACQQLCYCPGSAPALPSRREAQRDAPWAGTQQWARNGCQAPTCWSFWREPLAFGIASASPVQCAHSPVQRSRGQAGARAQSQGTASPGSSVLLGTLTAGGPALPRCAAGARVLEAPGPLLRVARCRGGELVTPKRHVRAEGTACAFPHRRLRCDCPHPTSPHLPPPLEFLWSTFR